jgi:hypothetical protein
VVVYAFTAIVALGSPVQRTGRKTPLGKISGAAFAILLVAIGVTYVARYSTLDFGPIPTGVEQPESIALFDFIVEETDEDDVFVFRKPRVLALYTGRRTSTYHSRKVEDQELWGYFHEIDAAYLVVAPEIDRSYLGPFVERNVDRLQEVYSNTGFTVYRLLVDPIAASPAGAQRAENTDQHREKIVSAEDKAAIQYGAGTAPRETIK